MRDFEVLVIKTILQKVLQDQEQQLLRLLPLAVQQDDYWLPAEISQVFPRQFRRGVFGISNISYRIKVRE